MILMPAPEQRLPAILAAAVLVVCLPFGTARADSACSQARLDLRGPDGRQSFTVEVADDAAERAQGLMNRKTLAPDAGMLFVYDTARPVQFWMKNTLIPLDMIFADAAGVVTRVHENARPLDLTPIPGGTARFVLEINGGLARRLGIVPGTLLRHPAITPDAAWPCN